MCAVFPLIWVGGLVTSYNAGMAVPDWPSTYGYNLFLYPWQTWIFGPWDLFIEHGHRLLGALTGLLTIGLAVVIYGCDGRKWMRWMGVLAIAGVVGQGVLGGMRVLMDQRSLAKLHGCSGPLFFAFSVSLVVLTSSWWRQAQPEKTFRGSTVWFAWLLVAASFGQLVLGANIRHITSHVSHQVYAGYVTSHVTLAILLLVMTGGFLAWICLIHRDVVWLIRRVALLLGLLGVQFGLGLATWLSKYGTPWASEWNVTLQASGWGAAMLATAHVAMGSLILALATSVALRASRLGVGASEITSTTVKPSARIEARVFA